MPPNSHHHGVCDLTKYASAAKACRSMRSTRCSFLVSYGIVHTCVRACIIPARVLSSSYNMRVTHSISAEYRAQSCIICPPQTPPCTPSPLWPCTRTGRASWGRAWTTLSSCTTPETGCVLLLLLLWNCRSCCAITRRKRFLKSKIASMLCCFADRPKSQEAVQIAHHRGVCVPAVLLARRAVRGLRRRRGVAVVLGVEIRQDVQEDRQRARQRAVDLHGVAPVGAVVGGHVWVGWTDQAVELEHMLPESR